MLIGALSLVMPVWLGTSMNRSRRSTRMPRWAIGTTNTQPGPLTSFGLVRPRVKIRSRSYWLTIRTAAKNRSSRTRPRKTTATATATSSIDALLSFRRRAGRHWFDDECQPILADDAHVGPVRDGASVGGLRSPFLADDAHDPRRCEVRRGDATGPDRHRRDTAGPECILVGTATPGGGARDPDHDEDHDDSHDSAGEDLVTRHVVTCCPDGSMDAAAGSTRSVSPSCPTTQTDSPAGISDPDTDRADHSSPTV